MISYKKPMVCSKEELNEGIYMASGDEQGGTTGDGTDTEEKPKRKCQSPSIKGHYNTHKCELCPADGEFFCAVKFKGGLGPYAPVWEWPFL